MRIAPAIKLSDDDKRTLTRWSRGKRTEAERRRLRGDTAQEHDPVHGRRHELAESRPCPYQELRPSPWDAQFVWFGPSSPAPCPPGAFSASNALAITIQP